MKSVKELMDEIKATTSSNGSCTVNKNDEVNFMTAMLTDTTYHVCDYQSNGAIDVFSPAKDFKEVCQDVLVNAANISKDEATELVKNFSPSKNSSSSMVRISKEFINSYSETGRKIGLGGRKTSNVFLAKKDVEEKEYKGGIGNEDSDKVTVVPSHSTMKVFGGCPKWVKTKDPEKWNEEEAEKIKTEMEDEARR